jgi:hypothetical protein
MCAYNQEICTNCLESTVCKDYTETIHTMSWIILCTEKKVEDKYLMKITPFFTGSQPVQYLYSICEDSFCFKCKIKPKCGL